MRYLLIAVLLLCTVGCAITPNAAFVAAVDANMQVICPRYTAYVAADTALTDDEKAVYTEQVTEFTAMIAAAKESAGISEEASE